MKQPVKFRIALCEDEKIFCETQGKICRDILQRLNIEYSIAVFQRSKDFLAAFLEGGQQYDLILLDIVMDGINGMEIARKIRRTDQEAEIIFITSNREYAIEGYDVGALHYLIKPLNADVLERLIVQTYKAKYENDYFILKIGVQSQRIPMKDIISLETVGRKVAVTLVEGVLHYPGKLTELLDGLPGGWLVRCHQAFAINIKNIRELNRFDAVAINGKVIPVSRPYLKDVQTAFLMNMQDV